VFGTLGSGHIASWSEIFYVAGRAVGCDAGQVAGRVVICVTGDVVMSHLLDGVVLSRLLGCITIIRGHIVSVVRQVYIRITWVLSSYLMQVTSRVQVGGELDMKSRVNFDSAVKFRIGRKSFGLAMKFQVRRVVWVGREIFVESQRESV